MYEKSVVSYLSCSNTFCTDIALHHPSDPKHHHPSDPKHHHPSDPFPFIFALFSVSVFFVYFFLFIGNPLCNALRHLDNLQLHGLLILSHFHQKSNWIYSLLEKGEQKYCYAIGKATLFKEFTKNKNNCGAFARNCKIKSSCSFQKLLLQLLFFLQLKAISNVITFLLQLNLSDMPLMLRHRRKIHTNTHAHTNQPVLNFEAPIQVIESVDSKYFSFTFFSLLSLFAYAERRQMKMVFQWRIKIEQNPTIWILTK